MPGQRQRGETAMAWLDRRAPTDPLGRLCIVHRTGQLTNPVLHQIQQLLSEDRSSVAEALRAFSRQRPEVAAFAWWHFFGTKPPWADSPDHPSPPQVVVPPWTARLPDKRAIAEYNWIGKAMRASREGVIEFSVAVAPELIAKCIAELGRLGWELIADDEATDGIQRLFLGTFRRR